MIENLVTRDSVEAAYGETSLGPENKEICVLCECSAHSTSAGYLNNQVDMISFSVDLSLFL